VVLAEITGVSGMAIIKAILAGSRDPAHLASLADIRVKKSREEVEAALQDRGGGSYCKVTPDKTACVIS